MAHNNPPAAPVDPASADALSYLPRGWQTAILELAKSGKGDGAFIGALGIAPQDFYALKYKNNEFAEILARAHAAGLEWLESRLVAIVNGHADARTQKTLEMIFNARFANFESKYMPPEISGLGQFHGDLEKLLSTVDLGTLIRAVEKRGILTRISTRAAKGESVKDMAQKWARAFSNICERIENGESVSEDKIKDFAQFAAWDLGTDANNADYAPTDADLALAEQSLKAAIENDERWAAGEAEKPAFDFCLENYEVLNSTPAPPCEPADEPAPQSTDEPTLAQKMKMAGGRCW